MCRAICFVAPGRMRREAGAEPAKQSGAEPAGGPAAARHFGARSANKMSAVVAESFRGR